MVEVTETGHLSHMSRMSKFSMLHGILYGNYTRFINEPLRVTGIVGQILLLAPLLVPVVLLIWKALPLRGWEMGVGFVMRPI